MKPIKPKYKDKVKVELHLTPLASKILEQYSKYTKYTESELIETLVADILDDNDFIKWIESKRYKARLDDVLEARSAKKKTMTEERTEADEREKEAGNA